MSNFVLLIIEFLDELVFGVTEAAWPLIKTELNLNYSQVGILLTVPGIFSSIVEPFLGILGDVWRRRLLILGGGFCFMLALLLTSLSASFIILLISFVLFYPASGAFVSLSQASLMDSDPTRHDLNMAHWTFAGSLGVVLGPPLLVGLSAIGFGWRGVFLSLAFFAGLVLALTWRKIPLDPCHRLRFPSVGIVADGFRSAFIALKANAVIRWLTLLQFSDLMLDVLLGFLALYFHDVVGLSEGQAAGGVFIWLVVGLLGDWLLIPLLKRMDGLRYLRISVVLETILFPLFLLVEPPLIKLVVVGLLGLFNSGWYAILKGRLYSAMPGQSGTVMVLDNFLVCLEACCLYVLDWQRMQSVWEMPCGSLWQDLSLLQSDCRSRGDLCEMQNDPLIIYTRPLL